MFHSIADFIQIWQEEAKNTEKLFQTLADDSLNKELVPGLRTLKQLAWHIVDTPREMLGHTGLKITGADLKAETPLTAAALIDMHNKMVAAVTHQVQTHWNNKDLHRTDNMYGEEWTRNKTLTALIFHLIHHRGQMTVFLRLAGIKVPGIYGPAKEEWQKYGMEPPVEI